MGGVHTKPSVVTTIGFGDPTLYEKKREWEARAREREREKERERVAQAEESLREASGVGKPTVESMMQKCSSLAVQESLDATVKDTAVGRQLAERGRRREE